MHVKKNWQKFGVAPMNENASIVELYEERYYDQQEMIREAGMREWWQNNKGKLKLSDLTKEILKALTAAGITISIIAGAVNVTPKVIQKILGQEKGVPELRMAPNAEATVEATVYQAAERQTLGDPTITADGTKLVPETGLSESGEKVIALSRNLLSRWGGLYNYGDKVEVSGTTEMDGVWIVRDAMASRFFNQIDFLVPLKENVRATGSWREVTIKKI